MILGMDRRQQRKGDSAENLDYQSLPDTRKSRCLDAACDEQALFETEMTTSEGERPLPENPLANGVVVGSVAALAATPAAEVRALVLDLCECKPACLPACLPLFPCM